MSVSYSLTLKRYDKKGKQVIYGKLEWCYQSLTLSPSKGEGVTVICPTDENEPAVSLHIEHGKYRAQWGLSLYSENGRFYIAYSPTGPHGADEVCGIAVLPKEIDQEVLNFPEKGLRLVQVSFP